MRISRRPTTLVFPVEDPRADFFIKNPHSLPWEAKIF